MTLEEADLLAMVKGYKEALDMAIKALEQEPVYYPPCIDCHKKMDEIRCAYDKLKEQEPCEDAISRQAMLDGLASIAKAKAKSDAQKSLMGRVMFFTERLPSVKPQEPKTGHWIMPVQDDGMSDPIFYQVRCSECGFDLDPQTWHMEIHQYGADKYCPNCGARMEEEEK